jgi:hypothetical protein
MGREASWTHAQGAPVERERVEQKDQKIRKYEHGSEAVIGAPIEVHRALGPGLLESARPSTPLAPTPSTFLIFPIFL